MIFREIFSNKNFDEIKDFENHNLVIKKIDDHIEIYFKLTNSVNIFSYNDGKYYYLSFDGITLTNEFGENIERHYKFFEKLILTKDTFFFIEKKEDLATIDFLSKEGQTIFKEWKERYKELISSIPQDDLIIELSAGMDTRMLSYFYRNLNKTYTVYSKPDPDEINEALNVINYINENFPVKLNVIHKKNKELICDKFNLNGGSLIRGLERPTTAEHFYDKIGNSLICNKAKHIIQDICPFYDKEYLKLYGSFPGYVKVSAFFDLCNEKELINLPVKSFKRETVNIENLRKRI